MRASLKSSKDRRIEAAICNLFADGKPPKPQRKNPHCCMLHTQPGRRKERGGGGRSLQPRLERQQSLIIMTLHKLRFNVNKETNIIISQLDSDGLPLQSLPPSPSPQLPSSVLVVASTSWPDVKVRAQTWRIICGCRKIFPAAAFSCHMQLAAAAAAAAI